VESRQRISFWWESNAICCYANLSDYDSVSNGALKQAWLAGFKEAQNRALDVEMKEVFLFHGKWENPWGSSFIDSLNIIDYCSLEINEDVNVLQMMCL